MFNKFKVCTLWCLSIPLKTLSSKIAGLLPASIAQPMTYRIVYLHRIVAEQSIGRKLRRGEIVHHRDEDKLNNSPENLEVCSSASVHQRHHARSLRQKLTADRPLIQVGDLWF